MARHLQEAVPLSLLATLVVSLPASLCLVAGAVRPNRWATLAGLLRAGTQALVFLCVLALDVLTSSGPMPARYGFFAWMGSMLVPIGAGPFFLLVWSIDRDRGAMLAALLGAVVSVLVLVGLGVSFVGLQQMNFLSSSSNDGVAEFFIGVGLYVGAVCLDLVATLVWFAGGLVARRAPTPE